MYICQTDSNINDCKESYHMKSLFCIMLLSLFMASNIFSQNCIDSIKNNSVLILKSDKALNKYVSLKNNKTDFILLNAKSKQVDAAYINSFNSKNVCVWNTKRFKRNKRSIIATSIIGILLTIPVLALSPQLSSRSNSREPIGAVISIMFLAPIAGSFDITAIGLGIKRAVILKKSKKNKLNCNF